MSNNRPTAEELRQGITVRIIQQDADVHATDEQPIVGEVATVYEDTPDGPHVKLKTGVTGHVQEVVADT